MGDKSKIDWTNSTWNPIVGCSITSPACTNCYAMAMADRIQLMTPESHYRGTTAPSKAGPVWTGKMAQAPDHILTKPLHWMRPRKIFVNSMGDLFHASVPDEWIDRVFAIMALTPLHTFQVLTKRPERMREYLASADRRAAWEIAADPRRDDAFLSHEDYRRLSHFEVSVPTARCYENTSYFRQWPLPNVLLGVTAEDQPRADERRSFLAALAAEGWVTYVSYEPALGPVNWSGWEFLRQLICGGESGPKARPAHPDWFLATRDWTAEAGVAFFFKQWGEWAPGEAFGLCEDGPVTTSSGDVRDWMNRYVVCADRADRVRGHSFTKHATDLVYRVGKRRAGHLLEGREHREFPLT